MLLVKTNRGLDTIRYIYGSRFNGFISQFHNNDSHQKVVL